MVKSIALCFVFALCVDVSYAEPNKAEFKCVATMSSVDSDGEMVQDVSMAKSFDFALDENTFYIPNIARSLNPEIEYFGFRLQDNYVEASKDFLMASVAAVLGGMLAPTEDLVKELNETIKLEVLASSTKKQNAVVFSSKMSCRDGSKNCLSKIIGGGPSVEDVKLDFEYTSQKSAPEGRVYKVKSSYIDRLLAQTDLEEQLSKFEVLCYEVSSASGTPYRYESFGKNAKGQYRTLQDYEKEVVYSNF